MAGDGDGAELAQIRDALLGSAAGDQEAFSRLYDLTSPRVYGLIVRVLRDRDQAQEVAQEVYLHVWREAATYRADKGTPLSWLLTIAHRRAVDRVRAESARSARDVRYEHRTRERPFDSTADTAQARLQGSAVRSALTRLSDAQREVLELAYLEGQTHREVSEALGIPLGTAKTRIRDGLQRLRREMGGEGSGGPERG